MKRLLISLWLGGAALYTVNTFIVTGVIRPPDDAKLALAPSAQNLKDNQREVQSWGSHLSHVAAKEQNAQGLGQDTYPLPQHMARAADDQTRDQDSAFEEPVAWARVLLPATVHSDSSVSSPVVTRYSPGTDLQAIRREYGWVKVVDPVTGKPGWIYEKHYLAWVDGPKPTQTALAPRERKLSESKLPEPVRRKPIKAKHSIKTSPVVVGDEMIAMYAAPRSARIADRRRPLAFGDRYASRKSSPTGRQAKRIMPRGTIIAWDPHRF